MAVLGLLYPESPSLSYECAILSRADVLLLYHALDARRKSALLLFRVADHSSQSGWPYGAAEPILRLRRNRVERLCASRGLPQDDEWREGDESATATCVVDSATQKSS